MKRKINKTKEQLISDLDEMRRLITELEASIVKNKHTEDSLHESQEQLNNSEVRYRRLFETAQDAILILNGDTGQIIDANPFLKDILGYSLEELQGKNLWEIGELKDTLASKISNQQLQDTGYVRYEHLPLVTKDGRRIAVEVVANAYQVDHMKVIQCNIRDISDRKKAEEAVRLNGARLESLLRILQYKGKNIREFLDYALFEALKITDSKIGYIYFYNEVSKEFTLSTWSKEVMKECAIPNPPTIYQLEKTGIWGEVVKQRVPFIVNDFQAPNPLKKGYPEGHVSLIRWMSVPVFSNEKIVAVVGVANSDANYSQADVNQLTLLMSSVWSFVEARKLEETIQFERDKLISILNSMEDGVCIMNRDLDIEYVNPSMESSYGKVNGKKCYQYFNDLEDVCSWCNNKEVFGGKILKRETLSNRTGKTYEITDAPMKNADGSISKLAVFHDITERKKVEQLKDEFIGMVSHEIKTPLTVIMGALLTAADERVSREQSRELIGDAVIHSEILASIIDNLLELSRQQSGQLVIRTQPVNIGEIAHKVIQKLQSKSAIHHFSVDLPPMLSTVLADPLRVERVIYNLVDNAIKYSPNGGEVKVFAKDDGTFLVIGVSDNGLGISREDQGRLFQSFERLGVTIDGSIQGTGLGLRVCRILVEAHEGRIWVQSDKDKGTTFFFTLPVVNR